MPTDLDVLASELEGRLQPPVDVMLDPSLLVASASLKRVADSDLFDAQAQATLGQTLTEPQVDDIHVPAAFRDLLNESEQIGTTRTPAWNFYRGQADPASTGAIVDLLEQYSVSSSAGRINSTLNWTHAIEPSGRSERLQTMLEEECAFLVDGGVLLSRTPESLRTLRDAGVVTLDLGRAQLAGETRERLTDLGYGDPASLCAFGISTVSSTVNGLAGNLLADHAELLCYRIGK